MYSKNYEDYLRRLHENVFIMTARWNGTRYDFPLIVCLNVRVRVRMCLFRLRARDFVSVA